MKVKFFTLLFTGSLLWGQDTGLDPIFWLHHANIDRLWQVWLNKGQRKNPTTASWLDFAFDFHDKNGNRVAMKCSQVVDKRQVLSAYTYQGLILSVPLVEPVDRFEKIDLPMPLEVVAATNKQLSLSSAKTIVQLKLTLHGLNRQILPH